jgi:hypothetical protein
MVIGIVLFPFSGSVFVRFCSLIVIFFPTKADKKKTT